MHSYQSSFRDCGDLGGLDSWGLGPWNQGLDNNLSGFWFRGWGPRGFELFGSLWFWDGDGCGDLAFCWTLCAERGCRLGDAGLEWWGASAFAPFVLKGCIGFSIHRSR